MTRAATIPAETDVLCEHCGYVLNGLPPGSNCPECGRPAADSDPGLRAPTAWEQTAAEGDSSATAFLATTAAVLFRPTRFYRTLATRIDTPQAVTFGQIYWILSSLLLSLAAYAHAAWFIFGDVRTRLDAFKWLALAVPTFLFVVLMNLLAARLTHWEASYRGLRLTLRVVRRGLYFHAVHYLPVALVAAVTVLAYGSCVWHGWLDPVRTTSYYLYTLCAEVVLAAVYLFKTYWTAMRNMMYANA
jgi:hypothetical protein